MEKLTDAERIPHSLLRAFLRDIGWTPGDYTAANIGLLLPYEAEPELIESGASLATKSSDSTGVADALLSLAWLLDQRAAPQRSLEAILPTWLTDHSAAACLVLARALRRSGEHQRAISMLQQSVGIAPASGWLHRELGLALRQQRRLGEAVMHIEASLEFRGPIQSDVAIDPMVPVLISQPNNHVDIYFYKGRFYLVRCNPDLVGARMIGGELFLIRRNAGYYCVRAVLDVPSVRTLVAAIRARRAAQRPQTVTAKELKVLLPPGLRARRRRVAAIVVNWWDVTLQRLALWTFARPIDQSADTITEAMELSRALYADSHPAQTDAGPYEPAKV